jgi:hypothetical protein
LQPQRNTNTVSTYVPDNLLAQIRAAAAAADRSVADFIRHTLKREVAGIPSQVVEEVEALIIGELSEADRAQGGER